MSESSGSEGEALRRVAIDRMLAMADGLEQDGVPSHIVMETMLAMGVSACVGTHGRENAATIVESLVLRIREGAFGDARGTEG
jgi:hypothetical protein